MGTKGHGLILATKAKPPKKYGDDGWNKLTGAYTDGERPETPWGEKCGGKFLGYYVALGGDREQAEVPDMDEPLSLAGGEEAWQGWPSRFRARYLRASAEWVKFDAWARERGVMLPAPGLYIVETELAG